MKLQFEFENVAGKHDLKDKITKKFAPLEKYLTHVKEDLHKAVIKIFRGERWGYRVRVDMKLPGKEVVAEARSSSLLDAIDEAYHKSARITRKYFEKLRDKRRG